MKAIRVHQFGEPGVLRLEEIPTPQPGAGQVLVRVHAIGVNPVETYLRSGSNPNLPLPYTPGTDIAGVVESSGANAGPWKRGDRVYNFGTLTGAYAEFALCDAAQVHALPTKLSFQEGAAIGVPYGTAWRAIHHRAQARAGETILIHGASGGVGIAAVQIARAAGLKVIGTAGTDAGRDLVAAQGAHHVLDHRQPGYLEQALTLTEGRGFNIILEMLANVNLGQDLPLLARYGRVIVIGSRGRVEINPRDLMTRDADVRAMMLFNITDAERAEIYGALGKGFEDGTLRPIIGRELPLAEAEQAHVAVMEPGAYGKIVLIP